MAFLRRLAAALTVVGARSARTRAGRGVGGAPAGLASAPPPPPAPPGATPRAAERSARFVGVLREPGATLWEAVLELPPGTGGGGDAGAGGAGGDGDASAREISGGEYEDEAEAARAYDALARMYLGAGARTNFARDAFSAWLPPEPPVADAAAAAEGGGDDAAAAAAGAAASTSAAPAPAASAAAAGLIETRVGVPLTAAEIAAALERERGVDVRVVSLAGRSDLADALVFVTGRSVPHMRRMADMVARALRRRRLPGVDAGVEARDMDDWMVRRRMHSACARARARSSRELARTHAPTLTSPALSRRAQVVDCGNVIVSVMDAEAREVFALEKYWEGMVLGQDPHAGLTFDQWLRDNPVPERWNARLERDEVELRARGTMAAAPPQGGSAAAAAGMGAGAGAAGSPRAARLSALGGAPGGARSRGPTQLARRRAEKKKTR